MSHTNTNNGDCPGCIAVIAKYPGFFKPLADWFFKVQSKHPTFHVADAGRGKVEQEIYFARGASRAHYGQSSHNYNIALDTFFIVDGKYNLDDTQYFSITGEIIPEVVWYGMRGAPFLEKPHFEWRSWRALRDSGDVQLVEPLP